MQQTNKSKEVPKNSWVKFSRGLLMDTSITANAKLVYATMLDKYMFFSSQNKEYYENLTDIGKSLGGMSKMTVSDCIKTLKAKGWLDVHKKKVYATAKSIISNSYTVRDVFGAYVPTTKPVQYEEEDSPF